MYSKEEIKATAEKLFAKFDGSVTVDVNDNEWGTDYEIGVVVDDRLIGKHFSEWRELEKESIAEHFGEFDDYCGLDRMDAYPSGHTYYKFSLTKDK